MTLMEVIAPPNKMRGLSCLFVGSDELKAGFELWVETEIRPLNVAYSDSIKYN